MNNKDMYWIKRSNGTWSNCTVHYPDNLTEHVVNHGDTILLV